MGTSAVLLLLLFCSTLVAARNHQIPPEEFGIRFYDKKCPKFEAIVQKRVKAWVQSDPSLAASLIELHFHDCYVRGCDASILLSHPGSEREAPQSRNLRGFQVIDDIKEDLERACPGIVSCADILAAAAREATTKTGGPFWEVEYGRKDGNISVASEAAVVPVGRENVTYLVEFYQELGLNILDLVTLSGVHTIGQATCDQVKFRLGDFEGTGKPDPSIDPRYLNFLQRKCKWGGAKVDFDPITPHKFDNAHFINLQRRMGLLLSDQLLQSDPRTRPLVASFAANNKLFFHQFAVSMENLGDTQVLTGTDEGEIRKKCSCVNTN
ncbi:peroxidase 7-like [Nymphaea colorata]|nr:peroxidase 7-like [Nymphaea colorata]